MGGQTVRIHSIAALEPRRLPYTLRILLENVLRAGDETGARALAAWDPAAEPSQEIAFFPSRVLMQDLTGVPAVVDLAAIRDAVAHLDHPRQELEVHLVADSGARRYELEVAQ